MVAYAGRSFLRQSFLASIALSSLLPFFYCGTWPKHNNFFHSLPVAIFVIIFSFLCSWSIPLLTHWVLQQFNKNTTMWTKEQIQANIKRISLPVVKTTITVSSITAVQGMLTIAWGMYVGQIAFKAVDVNPIVDLVGSRSTLVLGTLWVARLLAQVWFMLFVADFTNYGFHCLAHENKYLWKNMHYLHHEHLYPEHGFFSLHYGSKIEMILSNFCFMCGMIVFKTDLSSIAIFGLMSTTYTAAGHCGLDLSEYPFLNYLVHPNYHALHHRKFNVNYSEHFTIVDKWFGSYMAEDTKDKKQH